MTIVLNDPVGAGGRNRRSDVRRVQSLLAKGGWYPGLIDGLCGRRTLSAIVTFQRQFLHRPDGLIEPAGPTWRMLSHPYHAETGAVPADQVAPRFGDRVVLPVRAIQLTKKDVIDLKKTLQTEWAIPAGVDQAYAIIDTILNRLASGH